jgi:hypothetical protein
MAAPLVVGYLISLLVDDVRPGWAIRKPAAQSDGQARIDTAVFLRRKTLERVVECTAWNVMRYRRFRWETDFGDSEYRRPLS